ncbi:unnamed protein product (macronuclear) [Paramecium tetraurelia]|uniref:EF-hand domain-containing protein n=1 Tax=Paramecium tetraurelia TaxID=5888 RepID=A0D6A4_PARTE|nr:uncharacterized protein GSPATT00039303001 [Paramecium tetraurelia]CAK78571.1 unnamed protein product [Paramecium tetraurelia]|eukprot:XP_001445968.1 hypothetical protein (macronuclear) [Paramecium tetraurelia strain d4-2]
MSRSQQKQQQAAQTTQQANKSQVQAPAATRGKSPATAASQQPVQPAASGFDPSKYVKPGLSKDEVLKIKECFDIFDDDKSGSISPNEMKNAIIALGMEQSAEEIVNMIQDLDQDGSSLIDFEEFLNIFGFSGTIEDEQVLEKLYQEFDSSGQSKVTYEDFKRINDLVSERYTDQELREMVEYADKDKDGSLSWDEFKAVVQKEYPNQA